MKVNFAFHLETRSQSLEEEWRGTDSCCLKSSVKFPQSVMIWAAMSSAVLVHCGFLKSTVNAAIYQEILEHFMLPSADKLYGDADFLFQQDLAPAHTAKKGRPRLCWCPRRDFKLHPPLSPPPPPPTKKFRNADF